MHVPRGRPEKIDAHALEKVFRCLQVDFLQEVRRLDLGANASSGTSDRKDCAEPDDSDDWSEEQMNALQVAS